MIKLTQFCSSMAGENKNLGWFARTWLSNTLLNAKYPIKTFSFSSWSLHAKADHSTPYTIAIRPCFAAYAKVTPDRMVCCAVYSANGHHWHRFAGGIVILNDNDSFENSPYGVSMSFETHSARVISNLIAARRSHSAMQSNAHLIVHNLNAKVSRRLEWSVIQTIRCT